MQEDIQLIAPCGMNCGICLAYLRDKNQCLGCRVDEKKQVSIARCIIRNCKTNQTNQSGFCYECMEYPCKRLKALDKRYRTKYAMSMIANLDYLKANGHAAFTEKEANRWRCQKCGGGICVHRGYCYQCGEKPDG
ncbi:DUF3795 domain-containing protein [Chloroflexota bacterium]